VSSGRGTHSQDTAIYGIYEILTSQLAIYLGLPRKGQQQNKSLQTTRSTWLTVSRKGRRDMLAPLGSDKYAMLYGLRL